MPGMSPCASVMAGVIFSRAVSHINSPSLFSHQGVAVCQSLRSPGFLWKQQMPSLVFHWG